MGFHPSGQGFPAPAFNKAYLLEYFVIYGRKGVELPLAGEQGRLVDQQFSCQLTSGRLEERALEEGLLFFLLVKKE